MVCNHQRIVDVVSDEVSQYGYRVLPVIPDGSAHTTKQSLTDLCFQPVHVIVKQTHADSDTACRQCHAETSDPESLVVVPAVLG